MKKMNCFVSIVAGLFFAIAAHAAPLKVVALNLEWFPGQDMRASADDMARHAVVARKELEKIVPDLLIATEICEPEALREAISGIDGLHIHVASNFSEANRDPTRRGQQIVIASRLPAVAGWAESWKPTMEGLRRGFTFVVLENPDTGKLIMVYGLHLKSNMSDTPEQAQLNYDIRDASTAQLIEHMKQMEAEYGERGIEGWIIGGDINTNHDDQHGDKVVELLVAEGFWNTWSRIPAEQRHTWKGRIDRFGPSTLDYIFLKGFGEPDARNYIVPDTVSDHNAVIVTIDLPSFAE